MPLLIHNGGQEDLSVALIFRDVSRGDCITPNDPNNPGWMKVGWYVIGPGAFSKPQVLNFDLNTYRGTEILFFAYTNSLRWEGSPQRNKFFNINRPGIFGPQCLFDNTNCIEQVDFIPKDLPVPSQSTVVAYFNPPSFTGVPSVGLTAPSIFIEPGIFPNVGFAFFISGVGFIPGFSVNIAWDYVGDDGHFTQNANAATLLVDHFGKFSGTIPCSPLQFTGTLNVAANDPWNLSASATRRVS
jgi:hypothetical protein